MCFIAFDVGVADLVARTFSTLRRRKALTSTAESNLSNPV